MTPMTEIPLVVSGVDLDNEHTIDVIAGQLDDLFWSETAGIVTATVFAEGDLVSAAVEAAARIHASLDAAVVTHVYPDLVSISTIAERVGVSRQAARKWVTAAAAPFPHPYGVLDGQGRPVRVWRWADVLTWLKANKGWAAEERISSTSAALIDAQVRTSSVA